MLEHISTYENINTNKNTYILFNDIESTCIVIEGDSVSYFMDWETPPDIKYLNDPTYELIYIDSINIEGITSNYKEELTPDAHAKICEYLLKELKKKK